MDEVIKTVLQVITGLLGLSFLVFIHEMGHFLVAKWGGVRVEVFSIGFGKKLLQFERGGTIYCISAIPFGGYVAMSGEQLHSVDPVEPSELADSEKSQSANETSDNESAKLDESESVEHPEKPHSGEEVFTPASTGYNSGDFASKSIPLRAAIAFGGPFVNIVFAFAVLWGLFIYGVPEYEKERLIVGGVQEGFAGEKAGVLIKDTIIAINGNKTLGWNEFLETMAMSDGEELKLTILRGADTIQLPILPYIPEEFAEWGIAYVGVNPSIKVVIRNWLDHSPAKKSGMQKGDELLSINGQNLVSAHDLNRWVSKSEGKELLFKVKHPDGTIAEIKLAPKLFTPEQLPTLKKTRWLMGIQPMEMPLDPPMIRQYGMIEAVPKAWDKGIRMAEKPFIYIGKMIGGQISPKSMSGPVAIVGMIGWSFHAGLQKLVEFLALISMNLGIMNLLPLAVTDGGILMFLALEAIRGKPLAARTQMKINGVAMYFFIGFFVYVMYYDLLRIPMLFGN